MYGNGTSFNGILSPDTRDWERERFYQRQDAERRARELAERAAHWIGLRLTGMSFGSHAELRAVCLDIVANHYGPISDEQTEAVTRAIDALWSGQCERALLTQPPVRVTVTEHPRTITLSAA